MTTLYDKIYAVVRQVPRGYVATYGQIGRIVGCPARQVGYAMAALQENSGVPWQRVVNSRGRISVRSDGLPDTRQQRLLCAEGIVFSNTGAIDLDYYLWSGPDWAFLAEAGMNPVSN